MFSTSWIIPTQKTIKFLNAVSNEERTSRFYTMSYVGEDLLFDPTDCSIHSYSHPHNIRDSSTVVLSTYIVLNSLFKLFGDGRRPVTCFEALTLSLQDSDLQSNALRMGWWKCKKKIKKKTREREGKEMHLACVSFLLKDSEECGMLHFVAFLLFAHLLVLRFILSLFVGQFSFLILFKMFTCSSVWATICASFLL